MSMSKHNKNIFRKRLLTIIDSSQDILATADVKLFTANNISNTWLYSDLKGHLCFVLDHTLEAAFLILYDMKNLSRLFSIELYKHFNEYYAILSEKFHCFEVNNGCFIGFKFDDIKEAKSFGTIKKFDNNLLSILLQNSNFQKVHLDKLSTICKYCSLIKKKFQKKLPTMKNYSEGRILLFRDFKI